MLLRKIKIGKSSDFCKRIRNLLTTQSICKEAGGKLNQNLKRLRRA